MSDPKRPELDCGDNSCMFAINKGGMRTNGGCRCFENAGFHRSSIKSAMEILPEILALRAENAELKAERDKATDWARSNAQELLLCMDKRDKLQAERDALAAKVERVVAKLQIMDDYCEHVDGEDDDACHCSRTLTRITREALRSIAAMGGEE